MKKVVKFGGSSLANAEQFEKVGDIIRSEESRRFVVPSAPGKRFDGDTKVTDLLYSCYDAAAKDGDFEKILEEIKSRYNEIIKGLSLTFSLDEDFQVIKENFKAQIGRDYAASRGEYLNGKVMAAYLGYEFVDAADVIRFDKNGNLDSEKTDKLLGKRLSKCENAVVPGFYGAKEDGTVTTFSRGGSDVTGSLVAKAIKADMYENWTDVSGFLVTDPRIVKDPAVIETITYRELRELSYMGATVLHEDAIFPVRKEGIPINIRNTNRPDDKGTFIVESTCRKPKYTITGIAGKKGFCSINIEKSMMNSEIGFGRKVLQVFEDQGISFEHVPSGIDTMTVYVHQDEFEEKEQQVIAGIHRLVQPDFVEMESDLALIAVVGRGMKSTRGFPVRKEGIPINIRNTNRPDDKGTFIVESTCRKPKYTITGIAGKKGFCSINIEKSMMNSEIGFGRKVLQVFEDQGISFEHVPSGIDTMTVYVHQDEFEEKEQQVIAGIHRLVQPDFVEMESDLALIAVVGRGMKSTRGTAGRIFSALAHANVNVKMIDQGSSELNIIIGVENRDFENAVKAIYDIFVLTQM